MKKLNKILSFITILGLLIFVMPRKVEAATTVRASSQNSATTGTALSVAAPTGTTAGDAVIVVVTSDQQGRTITDNNGSTPFTKDTGATTPNVSTMTMAVFSRRIQAGDPTTYNFTSDGSTNWNVIAVTIQNPNASAIYDVLPTATTDTTADDSNIDTPDITTLNANSIHLVFGASDSSTVTITGIPATYTGLENVTATGVRRTRSAYKVIASASATGVQTFTSDGNFVQIGISMAIRDVDANAISFDKSSVSTVTTDFITPFTISWSHTTTLSGGNTILIVGAAMDDDDDTISGVTYNGVALTKIREDVNVGTSEGLTSLWYLVNPATSTNTITITSDTSFVSSVGFAITLTGVDQTNPLDAHNGTTADNVSSISTTVTTVANNSWIVDVVNLSNGLTGPTLNPTSGQTEAQTITPSSGSQSSIGYEGPITPAGGQTVSWNDGADAIDPDWVISAASFKPVGVASDPSGGTPTFYQKGSSFIKGNSYVK